MNYLDLFSGLGGFAIGAYWAGMKFDKHYFSEIEPYAVKLYQQRFPDAIPLGDIKEIDCEKLAVPDGTRIAQQEGSKPDERGRPINGSQEMANTEREHGDNGRYGSGAVCRERSGEAVVPGSDWIITGGFPCQDISVAGKGEGISGSRSGLWFEYWRVIRELRPRFAIIENVAMLTNRGLDVVLSSLAEIGYDAEWQDIRAEDMGAPHRRERIWIVAYPERDGRRSWRPECERQQGWIASNGTSGEVADTSRTVSESGARRRGVRESHTGIDGSHWAAITGLGGIASRIHPWVDGWEDGVPRLASKVPHRVDRLRGLGNSVVPQIAEVLFRQIKEG